MIRMATIDDIDSLVELRIKLLKEAKKNIENYNLDGKIALITDILSITT